AHPMLVSGSNKVQRSASQGPCPFEMRVNVPQPRRSSRYQRIVKGSPMNRFVMSRRMVIGSIGASAVVGFGHGAFAAPKTLEDVKKAGVLQIGCEAAYVPFTYRDKTGAIVGFDVEIVTAYLQPIGVRPEFIDTQWSGVIPALYAGRFDMVPTMSYTKERLERVLFSIPYADASQALLFRVAD